jgi:helicase required for RNAi-mediated heterochromatin assembly 1
MLLDTTFQVPSNPIPATRTPESSADITMRWGAYVNGGAAADDARYFEVAREEKEKFQELANHMTPAATAPSDPNQLIQISPAKKARSKNTNLLIDLDVGTEPDASHVSYAYAARGKKGKGKAVMSLLD